MAVVTRDTSAGSGTREVARFDLGAGISTNTGAQANETGAVGYAVGTDDGRVMVWPAVT